MKTLQKLLPWAALFFALLYAGVIFSNGVGHEQSGEFDFASAGRIPVSDGGRVKPLDTFARTNLLMISGRQSFVVEGRAEPATRWYFELLADPVVAASREVFRIDHPGVVSMLGLGEVKRTRFSLNEIAPHYKEFAKQASLAKQARPKDRDPYQRQIVELDNHLYRYYQVSQLEAPFVRAPLAAGQEWSQEPAQPSDHASSIALTRLREAFRKNDAKTFNTSAVEYLALVNGAIPHAANTCAYEMMFNRAEPFYHASVMYVLVFVLACVGFLLGSLTSPAWFRSFSRAAVMVLCVAFVIHTLGLASRVYLQGRPPVTNLYSSAVFIGWACIPLAMIAERFFRIGVGTIAAALIGFSTLVIAHNLASGDTMEMMQAVLDSNFWLATHVVVVTLGYSATFLAGFLAAGYILLGVLTPLLRGEGVKAVPKMVYGMICFATVTSFVGTVLGGVWADQSWGRFWGWDPKENGAVLIVFMNLLILHARWGGMIKDRGIAVLAVFGNIVTAWSWFGTNMLGVGLHAYGFMDSAVFWLLTFAGSQLVIMGVAAVPTRSWRSLTPAPGPRSAAASVA